MDVQALLELQTNTMCQTCEVTEASHFCKCTLPPTFFCLDCCGLHHVKYPRAIHQIMPFAVIGQNPEVYVSKTECLTKGAAELRSNLQQLDKFCNDFENLMRVCITYLSEYRSWWLQYMQTEKEALHAAIEAAVQEATNCLDKGVDPTSALAQALWTLPPEELRVVKFSVVIPDLQTLCQSWTTYQNDLPHLCARFPKGEEEDKGDVFAAVYKDTVELFDLKAQHCTRHSLSVNFGWGGSYAALERHTLLCIGSDPPSTDAYKLDLSSLKLSPISGLRMPRAFAGVATVRHLAYVFGGYIDSSKMTKSCEKYECEQWVPLGDMWEERSGFTPCIYLALVYLSSHCTRSLESFSSETEVFTVLPVSLPAQLEGYLSVAFVANGELCILTESKQLGIWKIGAETEFRLTATDKKCCSSQLPQVVGSIVLIANNCTETLAKFSLDNYVFV